MRTFTTVLALLGAIVMLASGLVKILSSGFRADQSDLYEIGGSQFPAWFFLAVGVFEVLIALALILPRTRVFGGLGLVVTMLGALLFNLSLASEVVGDAANPADFAPVNIALAVLGLLITLLWALVRRKDGKAAASKTATTAA